MRPADNWRDPPYVVIANIDGDQKLRLFRSAASACTSIRVGDYLSGEGEKQNERLFDANHVHVERLP